MINKKLIFGILMLVALTGCINLSSWSNQMNAGRDKGGEPIVIPEFTANAIKLAKNCGCSIDDVTRRLECICENPSWAGKVKVVCLTPPANEYEAMINCVATPVQ